MHRLSVNPECVTAFNELKLGRGGPKYIIYKISDDQKEVVVDEIGKETDYNVFREKLITAKEKNGKSRPSYAVYDVEFELEGGEGLLRRSEALFRTFVEQAGDGLFLLASDWTVLDVNRLMRECVWSREAKRFEPRRKRTRRRAAE